MKDKEKKENEKRRDRKKQRKKRRRGNRQEQERQKRHAITQAEQDTEQDQGEYIIHEGSGHDGLSKICLESLGFVKKLQGNTDTGRSERCAC